MPITAKLSEKFYNKLGTEVTNELVDWLNAVDRSYRDEFRDLFDANFGQVRAEMAALRSAVRGEMAALRSELRGEMAALRTELRGEMAALGNELRGEMAALGNGLRGDMAAMRTEQRADSAVFRADVDRKLAEQKASLIRWMFLFWIGSWATIVGSLLALGRMGILIQK